MGYWDVFLALAEIIAFVLLILGFTSKFNQTIGEFREAINQLKITVEILQKNKHETHKEIFDKLSDHEKRISHLEK